MLDTFRKYWIAVLVLVMIGLHASIVGLIRYQASLAKVDMSCEVELGRYLAYPKSDSVPIAMKLHAIVPLNHRMKSRQLIELNQAQIRQAIEEHIRQLDPRVMSDPYLSDLREQLLDVMVQTIGKSSIDDLTITEVQKSSGDSAIAFVSRGDTPKPRQLVATLRDNPESEPNDKESSDPHAESSEHPEGETETAEHAEPDHAKSDPHTAKPKSESHAKDHDKADDKSASGHSAHGETKPKSRPAVKYESGMGKKKKEEKKPAH